MLDRLELNLTRNEDDWEDIEEQTTAIKKKKLCSESEIKDATPSPICISSESEFETSPTKQAAINMDKQAYEDLLENTRRSIYDDLSCSSDEQDQYSTETQPSCSFAQTSQIECINIQSSDDENDETIVSNAVFYNDIIHLPVLLQQPTGVSTLLAARYILTTNSTSASISRTVPYGISANVGFLISSSAIGHWKNALSDGMGAWKNNGMKTKYIKYTSDQLIFISENQYGLPDTFKVRRTQFVNKSEDTLHKVMIRITNWLEKEKDLIVVQYFFRGEEVQVAVKSHGNSKSIHPYVRTKYTTMQNIKDLSTRKKPKDIFNTILETKGGVMGLSHPGELPRNRQQISDVKKTTKQTEEKDELKVLMDKIACENEKPDNTFIFELSTDPELVLFIAEELQMNDLEIFCTNAGNFCIFGIDPTFNIGNYMVTITQYRNLKLKTKRNVSPVMLGPVLIHQRKLQHSYFELPAKIIKYNPKLEGLLVYGTDGEHNLHKVFNLFFPNAMHLLCDLHMKDNIKSKLSKLQITKATASQFLEDIFGRDFEVDRQPGLVDAISVDDFDNKLATLKELWIQRHRNGLEFYLYFLEEKATLIKNHMTAEIRAMAGLGFPPVQYTQNADESINSAFKRGLDQKLSLSECLSKIQHYIRSQQEQVRLAVIGGGGEYEVKQEYKHLTVQDTLFYRMGQRSKKAALKKFFDADVLKRNLDSSSNVDEPEVESNMKRLSLSVSKCGITKIPFEIVEDIYKKATEILNKDDYMVKAPGSTGNHYFVVSLSKPSAPHSVKIVHMNGNITCDNNCIRWKTYRLCPHILVVADSIDGMLKKFLTWHKALKEPGSNLMTLSTLNLPSKRGRKAHKSTSIRKGSSNKQPKEPVAYVAASTSTSISPQNPMHSTPALPDPMSGSYQIGLLQFCSSNVAKCFGCQGYFKDNNQIPPIPRNMIIVSKMRRKYLKDGIEMEGPLSNVYFHFNEQCIKREDGYFLPSLLFCPDDLKPHLHDMHKELLQSARFSL